MAHEAGLERPHLKFFGGHGFDVKQREGDFVEQPVSSAVIGDILGTVRENHFTVVSVPRYQCSEPVNWRMTSGSCWS